MTLRRIIQSRQTVLWLSIIMPLWLGFGRAFFGVLGWFALIFFFIMPLLWLFITGVVLGYFFRKDVRRTHKLRKADILPLYTLFGLMFVTEFFLVDFGDAEDSAMSVFTRLTGLPLMEVSMLIALVLLGLAAGALVWVYVQLIISIRQNKE